MIPSLTDREYALHGRRRTLANQEEGVAISVPVQQVACRLAPVVGREKARHDRVLVDS
jgi:hypothetical protein